MRATGTALAILLFTGLMWTGFAWSDEKGWESYRSGVVVSTTIYDVERAPKLIASGGKGYLAYRHDGRYEMYRERRFQGHRPRYAPGHPYGPRYHYRPGYPYRYYSPYYYGGGYYNRQGTYFGISGCFRSGTVRICVNTVHPYR